MFSVEKRIEERILIISIKGYCKDEAGIEVLEIVNSELNSGLVKSVILDFSGCDFINSSCIARLMETAEQVVLESKKDLAVCGLDKTKATFFEMFGLLDFAELKPDLAEAKAFLTH